MAVTIPARVMGLPALARLQGRTASDVLHLSPDWQLAGTLDQTAQG
jgi:hypothetical protein